MSQPWSTNLSQTRSISPQHAFFVEKVMDKRESSFIQLDPDAQVILQFYDRSIAKLENASGVTLFLRAVEVKAGTQLELSMDFYFQGQFVYEFVRSKELLNSNDLGNALADLLSQAVLEFDASDVAVALFKLRSPTEELDRVKAMSNNGDSYELDTDEEEESRDVSALGYQIGGITLIGFDYEFRVSDLFGIHAGIGFAGYTAGVKIHTGKYKDSSFFNISLKDGGFGMMKTAALEYGGRLVGRNTGGFGFHGQVGLANVLFIDRELEQDLFGGEGVPPVLLSVGIGVSW